ncbi:MAG: tetratricopeptide repeat protein [Spirochaetaceae bacterium]|nr:tetratricopeptide repeat protein [Spirochaetaceae bacterium]
MTAYKTLFMNWAKTLSAPLFAAVLISCATAGGAGAVSLEEAIAQSAANIAANIATDLPQGTRVVIAAFNSPDKNLSGYIMDELSEALVNSNLETADGRNLEYVYKELRIQSSGDLDDESAVAIGKFLGAQYVITGELVNAGGGYLYRLNGINVETAAHESSNRFNVKNDAGFKNMLAALQEENPVTQTAGYGAEKTNPPKTAGTYLDRGITFMSREEYYMAIEDFTEAINLAPQLASAYNRRGFAHYREGDFDHAIADFNQAIKLDPNDAGAYYNRGMAYVDKGAGYDDEGAVRIDEGDLDSSLEDFNQAIKLDPNHAKAYFNRGRVYTQKEDCNRALADLSQAIKLDPNDARSYEYLNIVLIMIQFSNMQ